MKWGELEAHAIMCKVVTGQTTWKSITGKAQVIRQQLIARMPQCEVEVVVLGEFWQS